MPFLITLASLSVSANAGICLVDLDTGETDCAGELAPQIEEGIDGLRLTLNPRRPTTVAFDVEADDSVCEEVEETLEILMDDVTLIHSIRLMSSCSGRYRVEIDEGLLFYGSDSLSVVVPIEEITTSLTLRQSLGDEARTVFLAIDAL